METTEPGLRVTRSRQKRLISTDSLDSNSRPGTPLNKTVFPTIAECKSPSRPMRITRRSSISGTPVKTPVKSKKNSAADSINTSSAKLLQKPNPIFLPLQEEVVETSKTPSSSKSPNHGVEENNRLTSSKFQSPNTAEIVINQPNSESVSIEKEARNNITNNFDDSPTDVIIYSLSDDEDSKEIKGTPDQKQNKSISNINKNMAEEFKKIDNDKNNTSILETSKTPLSSKSPNQGVEENNRLTSSKLQSPNMAEIAVSQPNSKSVSIEKEARKNITNNFDDSEMDVLVYSLSDDDDNEKKDTPDQKQNKSIANIKKDNDKNNKSVIEILDDTRVCEKPSKGMVELLSNNTNKENIENLNMQIDVSTNELKIQPTKPMPELRRKFSPSGAREHIRKFKCIYPKTPGLNKSKNNNTKNDSDIMKADNSSIEIASTSVLPSFGLLEEKCKTPSQAQENVQILAVDTESPLAQNSKGVPMEMATPDKFLRSGKTYGESPSPKTSPSQKFSSPNSVKKQSPKKTTEVKGIVEIKQQTNDADSLNIENQINSSEQINGYNSTENNFARTWCQNVSGKINSTDKLDHILEAKHDSENLCATIVEEIVPATEIRDALHRQIEFEQDNEESAQVFGTETSNQLDQYDVDDSDGDENSNRNDYIDDEAMEVDENYQSGDSMNEDERREMEENQISDEGESIGSQDSFDPDLIDENEDDENSFIVSDTDEIEAKFSNSEEEIDELVLTDKKKTYKRIKNSVSSDSEPDEKIVSPKESLEKENLSQSSAVKGDKVIDSGIKPNDESFKLFKNKDVINESLISSKYQKNECDVNTRHLRDSELHLHFEDDVIGVTNETTHLELDGSLKKNKTVLKSNEVNKNSPIKLHGKEKKIDSQANKFHNMSLNLESKRKNVNQRKTSKSTSAAISTSSSDDEDGELPTLCQSLTLQRDQMYESSTDDGESDGLTTTFKMCENLDKNADIPSELLKLTPEDEEPTEQKYVECISKTASEIIDDQPECSNKVDNYSNEVDNLSQSFVYSLNQHKHENVKQGSKRKRLSQSVCSVDTDSDVQQFNKKLKTNEEKKLLHHNSPPQTSTNNVAKNVNTTMKHILSRCDSLLEAANQAKLEAKKNAKMSKRELSKKKRISAKKLKQQKVDVPFGCQKEQEKKKEKLNSVLKPKRQAPADILSNKEKKNEICFAQENIETKRLPVKSVEAPSVGESIRKSKKGENDNRQQTTAGIIVELPATPTPRRKKLKQMKLASGTVTVEPITPLKNKTNHGFRESPITPKSLGFKVRELLTAGQDMPSAKSIKNSKRKRKINFKEPISQLPKPQWTQSGVFMEEKLPTKQLFVQEEATQFSVISLKATESLATANNFKHNALFRSSIQREKPARYLGRQAFKANK